VVTFRQLSFAAGEIAPSLYARVDQVRYATGLRTCRNMFGMRHGGVSNRPGTGFIGELYHQSRKARLIPFVFNADQTYVLIFEHQRIRFVRNGALILEAEKSITAITQALPALVTSSFHGYVDGDEVYVTGISGMTELNGRQFKVANATTNTFSLQYMDGSEVDSSLFNAYVSGGAVARVYTVATSYVEADLPDLQYVQSADVLTLVHPNYQPRDLTRTGHTSWSLTVISFVPQISAPTGLAVSAGQGVVNEWVVTTVAAETFEESLQSSSVGSDTAASSAAPRTLTWDAVTGAQEYNVYKKKNGVFSFIGIAGSTTFVDDGIVPDQLDNPPIARNPFSGTGNFPSAVTYYQQRKLYANTDNAPEKTFTSKTGSFKNFTFSSPFQDDDAVTFQLAGRQVNEVRHMLELGTLVVLTSGGEWSINGDEAGVLTPTDVNSKQHGYNGSSTLQPIVAGGNALYVQARGGVVRDLLFDIQTDGYRGNDLTIFSAHLVDGYSILDWAYQQIPHSIVWMVRSDGTLLGLTYVREHEMVGWHRHDFDGSAENVTVIPSGNEDDLYLIIKRTVNGQVRRYVERMKTRSVGDIVDSVFVDSSLTYDGRNLVTSHTMLLSGGTTWAYTETLTLTSSLSFFTAQDVGNAIFLVGSDGTEVRCTITAFASGTSVSVTPHMTVPSAMRNAAISNWSRAVDEVTGLWHLEGKNVSVFADGTVVANPNNDSYVVRAVSSGTVTLDKPYAVIHVGLPYLSDIETLDIDSNQGETLADKKKLINRVTLFVESSRGIWVGPKPPTNDATNPKEFLTELKARSDEDYDDPVDLATGTVEVNIEPEWNSNGRIFVRQIDPVPLAVLAVAPSGLIPYQR
jgi:hypothetical protein